MVISLILLTKAFLFYPPVSLSLSYLRNIFRSTITEEHFSLKLITYNYLLEFNADVWRAISHFAKRAQFFLRHSLTRPLSHPVSPKG